MTGKISPRAIGRHSDANNAPKAARAGDRGFETGQKTGTIHAGSPLSGEFRILYHILLTKASAVQCDHLTDAEIEQKLQETAAGLKEARQYLDLAQFRGLPHDPLTQNQVIGSHKELIAMLEQDMKDLLAGRAKRKLA